MNLRCWPSRCHAESKQAAGSATASTALAGGWLRPSPALNAHPERSQLQGKAARRGRATHAVITRSKERRRYELSAVRSRAIADTTEAPRRGVQRRRRSSNCGRERGCSREYQGPHGAPWVRRTRARRRTWARAQAPLRRSSRRPPRRATPHLRCRPRAWPCSEGRRRAMSEPAAMPRSPDTMPSAAVLLVMMDY